MLCQVWVATTRTTFQRVFRGFPPGIRNPAGTMSFILAAEDAPMLALTFCPYSRNSASVPKNNTGWLHIRKSCSPGVSGRQVSPGTARSLSARPLLSGIRSDWKFADEKRTHPS